MKIYRRICQKMKRKEKKRKYIDGLFNQDQLCRIGGFYIDLSLDERIEGFFLGLAE